MAILLSVVNAQLWRAGCVLFWALMKWFPVVLMKQDAGQLCGGLSHLILLCFLSLFTDHRWMPVVIFVPFVE